MLELVPRNTGGMELDRDILLAKKRDPAAFERLILQNKISMYRVAKGMLKSEADIGDAMQEAILKAYRGLPALKKHAYFKTWLIKILINECNNILRYHKRVVPLESVVPEDIGMHQAIDSGELMSSVMELDGELKMVTILYYYEDLPVKTIASILDIPEGTVKSRLSRAREKLYGLLTGKEGYGNAR